MYALKNWRRFAQFFKSVLQKLMKSQGVNGLCHYTCAPKFFYMYIHGTLINIKTFDRNLN